MSVDTVKFIGHSFVCVIVMGFVYCVDTIANNLHCEDMGRKLRMSLWVTLCVLFCGSFGQIGVNGRLSGWLPSSEPEFRGLWMATVGNMDWPKNATSPPDVQRRELLNYLDVMNKTNLNSLIFHVRPCGDALYNSSLEPWSVYLTGRQGQPPNPPWDPLQVAIEEAHKRNIQVHAWLNPYIANESPNWDGLAPNHMAVKFREYAYPYGDFLWMDPGVPVVLGQLLLVVDDLMNRYSLDGIHIDDFFYPYPVPGIAFPDGRTYASYRKTGGSLSLADWRRYNINKLVHSLFLLTRKKPGMKFSVSPSGLYRPGSPHGMPPPISGFDPYSGTFADAKLWLQEGWVDFLVPQIYWAIEAANQSFPLILDWWLEQNTMGRPICAGVAAYRMVETGWDPTEVIREIEVSQDKRREKSLGNALFSASDLGQNVKGISNLLTKTVYKSKARPF